MPIGKILAVVTGSPRDGAVLSYAIEAARPFNAHVVALFVRPDLTEATPAPAEPHALLKERDAIENQVEATSESRLHEVIEDEGLTRERVLACAVRLLDRGMFRIGGETYAETNETFGLATMRKEHVKVTEREANSSELPGL